MYAYLFAVTVLDHDFGEASLVDGLRRLGDQTLDDALHHETQIFVFLNAVIESVLVMRNVTQSSTRVFGGAAPRDPC